MTDPCRILSIIENNMTLFNERHIKADMKRILESNKADCPVNIPVIKLKWKVYMVKVVLFTILSLTIIKKNDL